MLRVKGLARAVRAAVLALAAITVQPPGQASAQPVARTPVRVGIAGEGVHWVGFYVGVDRYFAEEGLDVQVTTFAGGTRLAAALVAGSVDVAVTSLDSALIAIQAGHPVRVFYVPDTSTDFVWFGRPGVRAWADLRGGTVGISTFGSLSDSLTRFTLRRRGLEPGVDVSVVQLGDNATRLATLRAGRVDAVLLYPPFTYAAVGLGLPRLGTPQTEIGEVWPESALATRERVLAEQPAMLRALLRGYVRGVRRTHADREGTVQLLMARLKYSRAEIEQALADILPTLGERGAPPPRRMAVFWQVMATTREIGEPWPEARFLDRRFIDTFDDWAPPH